MRYLLLFVFLLACKQFRPDEGSATPEADPRDAPVAPMLPAGFEIKGAPVVEEPYLRPFAMWRQLKSRLSTLQADARRRGKDVLVSFEPTAVHVTRTNGSRTTWRLAPGLALSVEIPHVVVRADLSLEGFDRTGAEVPAVEELTIAVATVNEEGTPPREFRLIVKGRTAFRSITSG